MGSALCCVEADPAPAYERGSQSTRTFFSPSATAQLTATLYRLQERGSLHARQYAQYHCACDDGSCPRAQDVRVVVDAYLSTAMLSTSRTDGTEAAPYTEALYRVTASLATFDESRSHDVAFVRATHRALVATTGDEVLAFALMIETAFVAAPSA